MQSRIQGFGSTNASGGGGSGGGGGSYDGIGSSGAGGDSFGGSSGGGHRMEGFGNPRYAAGSGYKPASRNSNLTSAAWEGAISVGSTALSGAGNALSGASNAISNGPLAGASNVLSGAGNALSSAGTALTGALSPRASGARGGREGRAMLDPVRTLVLNTSSSAMPVHTRDKSSLDRSYSRLNSPC